MVLRGTISLTSPPHVELLFTTAFNQNSCQIESVLKQKHVHQEKYSMPFFALFLNVKIPSCCDIAAAAAAALTQQLPPGFVAT